MPKPAKKIINAVSKGSAEFNLQWCPDISPGPIQPDNGKIRGVGHKTVLLPLRRIWLK